MQFRQIPRSVPASRANSISWKSRIDVLRSLQLHKWAASLIAACAVALALVLLLAHRSSYVATSVIAVSPNLRAGTLAENDRAKSYSAYLEEQIHAITSDDVLTNAVQSLKPGIWQQPKESLGESVERLRRGLTVKRDPQSYYQVQITLNGSKPTHLAETVNAVTHSYLDAVKTAESHGRNERFDSLRRAKARVRTDLADKLQEQARGTLQPGSAALSSEGDVGAVETGMSHHGLRVLRSSLTAKRASLLDQLASMPPDDAGRKTTERQLGQTLESLREIRLRLREQTADDTDQQPLSSTRRASLATSAPVPPTLAERRQILRTEIAALRARYTALDTEMLSADRQSDPPASVHLSFAAPAPTAPLPSYTRFILPLLLPFTLLVTVAGAVLIDLVDDRVHSRKDVEQLLGFAPMGTLFNDRDVTPAIFHKSTLLLAAGIDQLVRTSGVRTIVLTPATAGATSIAKHLGNTLAKLGRNTLAIDSTGKTPPVVYVPLDLAHAAHRELGAQLFARKNGHGGSTAVLAQPFAPSVTPLTNFIQEAFERPAMNYDLVLVDAPSILNAPYTEHVARFADVTVLIAEAGHTTKAQLVDASRLLQQLQIRGMATIINKIAFSRADRGMRDEERPQRNGR